MKYTDEQIIDALTQSGGIIKQAALLLNCSRWVITSRAKSSATIRQLCTGPRGGTIGTKQFSDDDIVRAVEAANGLLSIAAQNLGCSRRTIELRANESETVRTAIATERERLLDEAESELGKAIRKGKAWAITFVLSTLGKQRGYTRQQILDMNQTITVDLPESFNWVEPENEG